jgi:hypothetical protein
MKRILFVLLFTTYLANAQEKEKTYISGDTLFTSTGYNIIKGGQIKVGTGATPDGDFKYIRINQASIFRYSSTTGNNSGANSANAFPRNRSGYKYEVLSVNERGNKKNGYVYYIRIGNGPLRYEIDVENAIKAGELEVPDEYKLSKDPVGSKVSIADELLKLKNLKDAGVLTEEEFEAQKKKLLSQD